MDCDPHTVLKVLETIGQKCEQLHDRFSRNITTGALEIDELWSRVGISQKRTTFSDALRGDFYTFLAITAREKFIVSHHTGKRDIFNADTFLEDVSKRVEGRVQITTDSFHAYTKVVPKHLPERTDFATLQKMYALPLPPKDEVYRRYSPPRCVGVKLRVRVGEPRTDRISTSFVERSNLTLRHFNKRFARLGMGWSRKLDNHRYAMSLFICTYNLCKVHSTLGCTPAVGLKLTDETWTIERLIDEATK